MAKVRRTIRKVQRNTRYFDEQQWPVNVALFVLGGFLVGAACAYQRFDDSRWYANAWTSVIAVPLLIFGTMMALRFVSNRTVRRGMQFSLILSLVAHLVLIIASVELSIFSQATRRIVERPEVIERRIPDFNPFRPREEEQPDHERPVETPVPEMDSEPLEREVAEETQATPQPTPVPEIEATANPTTTQRQNAPTPTPRMSEAPSRLARSQPSMTPNIARAAPDPNSAQSAQRQASLQAASTQTQRRESSQAASAQMASAEPQPSRPNTTAVQRRQSRADPSDTPPRPTPPTLPRRVNTPSRTPVAQTTANATPSQSQQTTEQPLAAAPTAMSRRTTRSPETERSNVEPTPVQPEAASRTPVQRQQPTPENVQLASTPSPNPSRQQRVTSRPNPQTVAQQTSPTPSANSASAALAAAPTTTTTRAATQANAQRAATAEPTTPNPQAANSQVARRQSQASPQQVNEVSPAQLTRSDSPRPARPTDTPRAESTTALAQNSSADGALSAASTATTRSATARTEVARTTGSPNAATASSASPSNSRIASRSRQSSDSPAMASDAGGVSRRETQSRPTQVAQASVGDLSSSPAPAAGGLQAAASNASRQATSSPGAADNRRPSDSSANSPATQVAQASSARSSESDTPTIQPAVAPSTPQRSRMTGELASPTQIENPAFAKNTQSDGQQPAMQASPTALSRATAGTAGIGRSANLDRNDPAGASPSLVASASARRRESTRADDSMSELSDSQPSQIARSRAGADRPSSVLQAQDVERATAAGSDQPSELTATASASVERSASDSKRGAVNATRGESEVDIGPTRLVANNGADRAAGGGQPELNFESQTQAVQRQSKGGETTMSLAANKVADIPQAPEADGGGEPQVEAPDSTAVAQRQQPGGDQPASGGPSRATEEGPSAEPNGAEQVGQLAMARAAADADDEPGGAAGGSGDPSNEDEEDEEERRRRLAAARARAGGAPEVAIAGTVVADQVASDLPDEGQPSGIAAPDAASAAVQRQAQASGGMARDVGALADAGPPAAEIAGGAETSGAVRVRRAEAVDASVGAPLAGGGSGTPRRAATGPQFTANTQADQVEMAAVEQAGGLPNSSPLAAQGVAVGRVASGRAGPNSEAPIGAMADLSPSSGAAAAPASAATGQRAELAAAESPATGDPGPTVGGPKRTFSRIDGPQVADVASPSELMTSVAPNATGQEMAASLAAAATQVGRVQRASANATLSAEIDAMEGPSGLIGADAGSPGVTSRRASEDSVQLTTTEAKFRRQQQGGLPDFNTAAIAAAAPFQRRADRGKGESGGSPGAPGPQTERAIESGLVFLTKYQLPDGSWSLKGINNEPVTYSSDAASTGLCLLAFQGAGYNHREHKYAEVVRSGLDFLVKNQDEEGSLYVPADSRSNQFVKLYTHGIATIALCEAYGMTQDPALREPAQKALDYIINTQDKTYGGWRYTPGRFSDTSVTGWMMMALKSGELAGLEVDKNAYTRIQLWLTRSQASPQDAHLYVYNPLAPNTPTRRLGREPSKTMTAVGLLARLYMGWRRDNANMVKGADYLSEAENLPAIGFREELNPLKKKRDTYYWYYGTQVMFHMGGDHWKKWNDAMHPLLIDSQVKSGNLAGSWDPYEPVPDRWGVAVGRLYVTTMNLLSLEVYYRHLPLYEDAAN